MPSDDPTALDIFISYSHRDVTATKLDDVFEV